MHDLRMPRMTVGLFLFLAISVWPPYALAETVNFGTAPSQPAPNTNGLPQAPSLENTTQGTTINQGAQEAANRELAVAAYDEAVALIFFKKCFDDNDMMYCAWGMQLIQQANSLRADAANSLKTADASQLNKGGGSNSNSFGKATGNGQFGKVTGAVKEAEKKMAEQGMKVNSDGSVTTANGKTFSSAATSTASGVAAMGFNPKSLEEAQKLAEGIRIDSRSPASAVSEGGGSSYHLPSDSGSSFASGSRRGVASLKGSSAAGKTVMLDGEPIGVRNDNIFEMIHKCYERKRATNNFIEGEEGHSARAAGPMPPGFK